MSGPITHRGLRLKPVSATMACGRTRNVFPIIVTMVARRMNITAAIALAVDCPRPAHLNRNRHFLDRVARHAAREP